MFIFTRAWWAAAGQRAAATVVAALIPLTGLLIGGGATPTQALSLSAAVGAASVLTSLAGLPEVTGRSVSLWRAIVVRCAKTLGQTGAVMFVGVRLIEAVDWRDFGITVGGAVAVTLLRTVLAYLPEVDTEELHTADEWDAIEAAERDAGKHEA